MYLSVRSNKLEIWNILSVSNKDSISSIIWLNLVFFRWGVAGESELAETSIKIAQANNWNTTQDKKICSKL
jgi:hypothetical protein